MTVTAQRRQLPVVPLTLTSDLTLHQSPQQLSPTALSSPINITQVRFMCAAEFLSTFRTPFPGLLACPMGLFQCYCGWNNRSFTQKFTGTPTLVIRKQYLYYLEPRVSNLSSGHACRVSDAGAAAGSVPFV